MLERAIVLFGAVIVGLILFLPSEHVDMQSSVEQDIRKLSQQADGSSGSSTSRDPQGSTPAWYSGAHSLRRANDGHFYADAYVQGSPVRFLIDTGASVVALTADDAHAAGLQWDNSNVRVIGTGANGPVYGVSRTISELEMGGITRRNIDAVIIPRGLEISLLGQSFLSQVASVEISGDEMLLEDG